MADLHPTLSVGRTHGVYPLPSVPGMPLTRIDPSLADELQESVAEIGSLPKSVPDPSMETASAWYTRPASPKEYDRDSRLDMMIGRLRAMREENPQEYIQRYGNMPLERRPPKAVQYENPLEVGMPLREGLDWASALPSLAANAYRMARGREGAGDDFANAANVMLLRIPQAASQAEMNPERSAAQRQRDSLPFSDGRLLAGYSPAQIVPGQARQDGLTQWSNVLREEGAPNHWATDMAGMVLDGLVDANPVGIDAAASIGRAITSRSARAANLSRGLGSAATDLSLPALFTGASVYGRQDPNTR